jgi:hypothetical protein
LLGLLGAELGQPDLELDLQVTNAILVSHSLSKDPDNFIGLADPLLFDLDSPSIHMYHLLFKTQQGILKADIKFGEEVDLINPPEFGVRVL